MSRVVRLAEKHGIQVFVFEEGYVRGDYVTLEKEGVNGRTSLPRSAAYYLNADMPVISAPQKVGYSFLHQAWWAFLYHASSTLMSRVYPCHTYHRGLGARELFPQIRSYWRWLAYKPINKIHQKRFSGKLKERYFLVPLQVHGDSQVIHHSRYGKAGGVPSFIREVIASFAMHAPEDTHLVLKHHPADRGYTHYGRLIRSCARKYGITGRVHYVHDVHLPTLQDHSMGVVTINSTVGLSSISRHKPVKVMGQAIYDIPGLTFRGPLDEFWRACESWRPDAELMRRFLAHVIATTQINGNFYKRIKSSPLSCGLIWPAHKYESSRLRTHKMGCA